MGGVARATLTVLLEQRDQHLDPLVGAELGCVAVCEVLDIIGAPGFLERVREVVDDPSVLRCKPALVIIDDDADWLIDTVRATFG